MLKKVIIIIFIFFNFALNSLNIPNAFQLIEADSFISSQFDIKYEDKSYGTVSQEFFSSTLEYSLKNTKNTLLAKSVKRPSLFNNIFDVFDAKGNNLGSIEENCFAFFPSFDFFSSEGKNIARVSMNFWQNKYLIFNSDSNNLLSELNCSFFDSKNDWSINIKNSKELNQKKVHPHMMFTLIVHHKNLLNNRQKNESINSLLPKVLSIIEKLKISDTLEDDIAIINEDFAYIQNITDKLEVRDFSSENEKAHAIIDTLNDYIEKQLSISQKKALLNMLEKRFINFL